MVFPRVRGLVSTINDLNVKLADPRYVFVAQGSGTGRRPGAMAVLGTPWNATIYNFYLFGNVYNAFTYTKYELI